jgi:hypothetical protein
MDSDEDSVQADQGGERFERVENAIRGAQDQRSAMVFARASLPEGSSAGK